MLLALKNHLAKLALTAVLLFFVLPNCCGSQTQLFVANLAAASALHPASLDPAGDALLSLGSDGVTIQQARMEVLSVLAEPNSCSAWFQTAEPQVAQKFRSLVFAVEATGSGDILKLTSWREGASYYQPYVARTGQDVGWGSTITLNENGAFFKKMARVRVVTSSDDMGYLASYQPLSIGGYAGATLPARVLALLHELGHVVNLLPLDSGVPLGPSISVQNTEKVLHYCGAQIRAHKKPSRNAGDAPILSASAPLPPQDFGVKPRPLGGNLQ